MADIDALITANRAAVEDLIGVAEKSGMAWTAPRAPGKWSPSQLVEHVARSLEESANVVSGAPSKFPNLPRFLRPLARGMLFSRVLKTGAFPKVKTSRALDPDRGPDSPTGARPRLEAACGRFEQACRDRAASGQAVASTAFGKVSLVDYARFQEIHTRHHRKQMPV